jgi:hypothetical protein
MKYLIIIDTSYLLELWKIGANWNQTAHDNVVSIFTKNMELASYFVTPAILFELANHIADERNSATRRKHALQFQETTQSAINENCPWTVLGYSNSNVLSALQSLGDTLVKNADAFASTYAAQGIGLTDVTTIEAARHLKNTYRSTLVHIWTRDNALKAYEPDAETNSFV